jgi:hypothetical protein
MVDSAAEARLRAEARARTAAMKADADPLKALQTSVKESKAQVEKKNIEIPTIALEQAINTGDLDAVRAAATELGKAQGLTGSELRTFSYKATQDAAKGDKPTPPPADSQFTYDYVWRQDVGSPGGKWVLVKSPIVGAGLELGTGIDTGTGTGTGIDTGTGTGTGIDTGTSTTTPTLAKDTFRNTLALFFGAGEVGKGWVDQLYNVVSKYYKTGSSIDESLNLALQDARNNPALSEFTRRFKGIYALQDLRQAGKPVTVPTIAEYVTSQAALADYLVGSGLSTLATEDFTGDILGKGISVSTATDRLAKVFDRIDKAPKAIKDTLSRYFPTVDRGTLAKTLLLGEKGTKQLADELAGYEVLSAAEQQGIAATGAGARAGGVTEQRAQEYSRMGYTYPDILPEFGKIAQATPTVSKLAGISKRADIGQIGVEEAVLMKSAKQVQELEKLSKEEEARFAGKAGRLELGLASQRRANRAF